MAFSTVTNFKGCRHTVTTSVLDSTLLDRLHAFYTHFNNTTPVLPPISLGEITLRVTWAQILRVLQGVNTWKSKGPDGVSPRPLKACAVELADVYTDTFNAKLAKAAVPLLYKHSLIAPVLKRPHTTGMNDFGPVVLTLVVMKCLEKLVLRFMASIIPITTDPFQFTYWRNRSVDDPVALILQSALEYLDKPKTRPACSF